MAVLGTTLFELGLAVGASEPDGPIEGEYNKRE